MLNVDQFISAKNQLLCSPCLDKEPVLHILLCFDNNYALPAGVAITSVIENNPQQTIHFHLFTHNVSEENRQKFRSITANNAAITEYVINDQFQIDDQNTTQFPISACVRLIAPMVLKDITNRLLYIDSDTLCLASLTSIMALDMHNTIIAAVADMDYMQQAQCNRYNITVGTYFNSGVMLINVALWCQNDVTQKTLQLLNSGEKFDYPDQDVLNIVVGDKRVMLNQKYDYLLALSPDGNEDAGIPKDIVLLHYITKNKPWHQPYRTRLYNHYLSTSPWVNNELPRYEGKKTSSIRQYSRLMYRQGHYFAAIKYYFCYLQKNFLSKYII
ncbi:glycosyltransferase [Orbaceae bacterium ESL0727]|nr:glycosyltransferase [Orbaceae bacterium ESL0727]